MGMWGFGPTILTSKEKERRAVYGDSGIVGEGERWYDGMMVWCVMDVGAVRTGFEVMDSFVRVCF